MAGFSTTLLAITSIIRIRPSMNLAGNVTMDHFFRYRSDRIPVALIAGLFAFDLVVYGLVDDWRWVLAWVLAGLFPKACICSWNHHHQHLPTFHQPWMNRVLEIVYGLHTGITTNAWVLHHVLGHHVNYLDQAKDESAWARKDGSTMGVVEYTFHLAITGYPRAYRVGKMHPRFQRQFLSMGVLVMCLVGVMIYYKPLNAILIFVLPMLMGYVITCWHTYYHHAGLHTDDHFEASYNITHKWYNLMTGNLGYHTAHHIRQGLHWSLLPEFHRALEGRIPKHLYRDPPIPVRFF
jgi:fatty acid desaturase